ncbi:MAG: glycosyltransferase family 4 protein [Candidatus Sungbacteria bacterium]|nr:glycosyltransferase family 4 protein [Candidatus Sungbacteria bacterium]
MRLLIVTQKVDKNDENLGPFYYWFEEFKKHCSSVTVIAAVRGGSSPPAGVEVFTFGKDEGRGRMMRIWKFWEIFSYHYARSDAVFFHQIPEFVLAASPFILSLRRPSGLWYAHKSVTTRLKFAERMVDYIFTSSAEGFRLPSKKVLYVGQAIRTDFFAPLANFIGSNRQGLRLITVGRIAPVKNYEAIIGACAMLKEKWPRPWSLSIVGGPMLARDKEYLESLKKMVEGKGLVSYVSFYGPRPYAELPEILREHDMFLNTSGTGSLDKAILDAMSSGLTVITSNEAYRNILPPQYFLEEPNPALLAERIRTLGDENRPNLALREIVVRNHNLSQTIARIVSALSSMP